MAGTDFVEALLHWKFPAVALPPSLARAYQQLAASSVRAPSPKETPTDDKQWLQHRRIEWQTSFRSLYYAFVGGNCTEFYVVARSNRDNLFSGFVTVFSKRAATGDDDGIMAILSCTTRGLRKGLEDEAVEYDMPASGSSTASEGTKVGHCSLKIERRYTRWDTKFSRQGARQGQCCWVVRLPFELDGGCPGRCPDSLRCLPLRECCNWPR
jgi:hypothetical protein